MEEKTYNLLSLISEECKGEYRLFSKKDLLSSLGDDSVTEEKLNLAIDSLAASGYIEKKYADKDVVLLKPSAKSLTAVKDADSKVTERFAAGDVKNDFLRFIISFLGGFSGALVGIAIFAALC